jgi:hypothetical protein
MVGRGMPKGSIRITASPSQDRGTVNNEVTSSNKPSSESLENCQDEERLVHRSASGMAAFALLGFAGNAGLSLFIHWQPTSQGQSRPTLEPVVHILIR